MAAAQASSAYYDLALFFAASPVSDYSSDDNSHLPHMPSPTSPQDVFYPPPSSYERDSNVVPGYRNNGYRQDGFANAPSGYDVRHTSPTATSPTFPSFYPSSSTSSTPSHSYNHYVASSSSQQQQPLPPSWSAINSSGHYNSYEFTAVHGDSYPEPSTSYAPPSSPRNQDDAPTSLPPVDSVLGRFAPTSQRIHPSLSLRERSGGSSLRTNTRPEPSSSRQRHSHHPYPQTRRESAGHRSNLPQVGQQVQQPTSPSTSISFAPLTAPSAPPAAIVTVPAPASSPLYSYSRTTSGAAPLEKTFICKTCSAAFARNHDLNRHHKVHDPVKQYRCNGCDRSFTRKDALKRHATQKNCGYLPNTVPTAGSSTKRSQSSRKTANAGNVSSSRTKSTSNSAADMTQQLGVTPQSIPQAAPSFSSYESESPLSQPRRGHSQLHRDYQPYYPSA